MGLSGVPKKFLKKSQVLVINCFNSVYNFFFQKNPPSIINNQYFNFIKYYEPQSNELIELQHITQFFFYRPIISIIVILNFENRFLFQSVIESINNQNYENWELCIIIHKSSIDYVNRTLKDILLKTDRIKLIILSEQNGIAEIYNEALNISNGDYICFLKPGDEIAPFAFYEIIKLLNERHDLQIIYSDEDTIDKNGKRSNPFFKPDWSPDHFLSQDFISHFYLIQKTLALSIGGFRSGFEGSEHYDLLLRSTEKIVPKTIAHIPKVLYHKRISDFFKTIVFPKQNCSIPKSFDTTFIF